MAFDVLKDLVGSIIATAPTPSSTGTTLTVATGDGAKWPAPPFNATIYPLGMLPEQASATAEIVRITAITGDVFTIVRQQSGTVARQVVAFDRIVLTVTSKSFATAAQFGTDGTVGGPGGTALSNTIVTTSSLAGQAFPPATTTDTFLTQIQFVAQKNGNDSANGLSWATPKLSIEAALAALPSGGTVYIAPGTYAPASRLLINGHHLFGCLKTAGPVNAVVGLNCNFADTLIEIVHGGQLTNLYLGANNASAGDAIYCLSPPFASPNGAIAGSGTPATVTGNSPCTGFTAGAGYVSIDSEVFSYSAFSAGVFTVTGRAVGGSTMVAHTTSSPIAQATVLTGALTAGATTASVASTANYPKVGSVTIDSETIFYTGITANSLTGLIRGYGGTVIAAHNNGQAVLQYNTRPGQILVHNVDIGGGFANGFHLDGSNNNYPGGPGIRQVSVNRGFWFGTLAGGQSLLLSRVVHGYFGQLDLNPAGGVSAGIQVLDNISEEVHFDGVYVNGNFESAAGGTAGDPTGPVVFKGYVAGNVLFDAGSAGNRIIGPILGTVTNNGASTNLTDKQPWVAPTLFNSWVNGSGATAGYRTEANGMVKLRGFINSGTTTTNKAAGTTLFTLPTGYRPTQNLVLSAYAFNDAGAAVLTQIAVNTGGQVTLQTALGTAAAAAYIALESTATFSIF